MEPTPGAEQRPGLLVLPPTPPISPPRTSCIWGGTAKLGKDGRALRCSDARRCPGRWSPASMQVPGPASGWRARSSGRPGLALPRSERKSQPLKSQRFKSQMTKKSPGLDLPADGCRAAEPEELQAQAAQGGCSLALCPSSAGPGPSSPTPCSQD